LALAQGFSNMIWVLLPWDLYRYAFLLLVSQGHQLGFWNASALELFSGFWRPKWVMVSVQLWARVQVVALMSFLGCGVFAAEFVLRDVVCVTA
ncbi:hypothetical protein U1Q18_049974, partial [Sarracenia purpurea var. burkii]